MENYEIERKFLIAFPDLAKLSRQATRRLEMVQTYLTAAEGESRRVRKITEAGKVTYWKTEKKRISDIRRLETETEISEDTYCTLLREADRERRPIEKVRYCVPNGHQTLEIDIFPFWEDKAFLEVELSDEQEAIALPPEFHVLREVTGDKRYTNAALAKALPE
ncbi:MAG: hypothetical protein E7408_05055 [Ruminococcaceae bacterium]|nr:hypothetical protein [Oscillospiraceae bacterium]